MGVGGGVDDDAVKLLVGGLDGVHNGAFVVGLETLHLHAVFLAHLVDEAEQALVGLGAVDVFFPDAQHVDVGAVNDQQLHKMPP